MQLAECCRPEVGALDRKTVVVAPFASTEQHSLHLPLGTDAIITDAIARRTDARLDHRLLVLPVQWLGCSHHHMAFAGSMTASLQNFIAQTVDIADSVIQHGFRRILLLNGHGGNQAALDVALQLVRQKHPDTEVVHVSYWRIAADEIRAIRETPLGGIGHSGELETSIALHLCPQWVRTDRVGADDSWGRPSQWVANDMQSPGLVSAYRTFDQLSDHGGLGDPRTATADKGRRLLEAIVGRLAQLVEDMENDRLWQA